jgi:cation:H+ antiporter
MLQSIALILVGFALLYAGGEALVRGAGGLALRLGMSSFIVGMTVVAFATSSPELAVSLQAAVGGQDEVAIGNVIGSNICNIALVLGLCALIRPQEVQMRILRMDVPWLIFASALLVAFLDDGRLTRPAGVVLLIGLAVFIYWNIQMARRDKEEDRVREEFEQVVHDRHRRPWVDWLLMAAGFGALVAGGATFVRGGVGLAEVLGVSAALISLTVVALGTSLPELATSLVATFRGDGDIAVGNIIGSNFFNILAILGITAVIHPLSRGAITLVDLYVMLAFTAVLLPLIFVRRRIGRPEGLVLLLGYGAYMWWLAVQAGPA